MQRRDVLHSVRILIASDKRPICVHLHRWILSSLWIFLLTYLKCNSKVWPSWKKYFSVSYKHGLCLDFFLSIDFYLCRCTCQRALSRFCGGFFWPIFLSRRLFVEAALVLGIHSLTLVCKLDWSKRNKLCCDSCCEAVLCFRIQQFIGNTEKEEEQKEEEAILKAMSQQKL